jgi:hypothetical protein
MERTPQSPEDGTPGGVPGDSRLWLLPLAGLLAWQGWMTLQLFGDDSWNSLRDERPILSGRHPLHLYHGHLGAHAFLRHGSTSCYDPAFQAGYPKTPVFDGGSRPAELFLCACGGHYRPSAYKAGLAVCCLLVPFAFLIACRGAGLNRRAVLLGVILGLFVWWGGPCQAGLHEGNLDLLLASLSVLVLGGLLIRFHRKPGGRAWGGLLLSGFVGYLFHPLLLVLMLPLFLIYYLSVGARHRMVWSVLLLGGWFLAIGANYFWLHDWVRYWWLLVPPSPGELLLPHRTFSTLWHSSLWGDAADRTLTMVLMLLAFVGAGIFNQSSQRATARFFGLGSLVMFLLAVGGVLNGEMGRLGATVLLIPALFFAVPLAAHALEMGWRLLCAWLGQSWKAAGVVAAALSGLAFLPGVRPAIVHHATKVEAFTLGLNPAQEHVVEMLKEHTATSARILWETPPNSAIGSGWTTLLPILTGRSYIGGLESAGTIEHTADSLTRQTLDGRPLSEWTDKDLTDYCERYNIGWVVCWTKPTAERFLRWTGRQPVATLGPENEGILLALDRQHSFILRGQARWLGAELSRVRLADVRPDNGVIELSLHYQEGLVASPGRVQIKKIDKGDNIPLVQLLVDAPVAHLTLVWQK